MRTRVVVVGGWQARWLFTLAAFGVPAMAQAQTTTLVVDGLVANRLMLSMDDLKALPHERIDIAEHGTFDAMRLSSVLRRAGITLGGEPLSGPVLTQALLVTAADGYQVIFALAELVPSSAHPILLADGREGRPLSAREGPLCIVAAGDSSPPRWVRQVVRLTVVGVGTSPNRQR